MLIKIRKKKHIWTFSILPLFIDDVYNLDSRFKGSKICLIWPFLSAGFSLLFQLQVYLLEPNAFPFTAK